ncbi:MAG: antitoxin VapB family protein [Thaumarchaeota archaeon]|nr:antitoxin VapB family protein [Nitrososphaerota archaeon]
MASKNIAIREAVYAKLLEGKRDEESFSDVIERLLEGKSELMSYAGVFSGDDEFDGMLKDIAAVRKRTVLRR